MPRFMTTLLALCCCATTAGPAPGAPAGSSPRAEAAGLWMSDSPLDNGRRLLIVVDPASKRAAVYHIDTATGTLSLKSARDLTWDLALEDFNAQEPRPAALKAMLQPGAGPASPPAAPR